LNVRPRTFEHVQQKLQGISNVLSVDAVFGPYDLICAVKASNEEDLRQLILHIQQEIPPIQGTMTAIAASF